MAKILQNNPELLLKLMATSMGLSVAVTKLYSYKMLLLGELTEDVKYLEGLELSYSLYAEEDKAMAENWAAASFEADKLAME